MSRVTVRKDSKGPTYIISHVRSGYHECIWLMTEELKELREKLNAMEL